MIVVAAPSSAFQWSSSSVLSSVSSVVAACNFDARYQCNPVRGASDCRGISSSAIRRLAGCSLGCMSGWRDLDHCGEHHEGRREAELRHEDNFRSVVLPSAGGGVIPILLHVLGPPGPREFHHKAMPKDCSYAHSVRHERDRASCAMRSTCVLNPNAPAHGSRFIYSRSAPGSRARSLSKVPSGRWPAFRATSRTRQSENPNDGRARYRISARTTVSAS